MQELEDLKNESDWACNWSVQDISFMQNIW